MKNLCIAILGLAVITSCGGDDENTGACPAFASCGGDVTGTWTISQNCNVNSAVTAEDLAVENCPTATADASGLRLSGSVNYKADKTYASTLTMSGSVKIQMPKSCLTTNGITLTCAQLDAGVKDVVAEDPDLESGSCSGSGDCTCTMSFKPSTEMESGTWSSSGNRLASTDSTGEAESSEYCVSGNELRLSVDVTMPMGNMGTATLRPYVIAKR